MRSLVVTAFLLALGLSAGLGRAEETRPCGAHGGVTVPDTGLRVQVDPETGTYSMPAPTAPAPATTGDQGARDADTLVVTPGTTAAGGYTVRLHDAAAPEQR